MELILQRPAPLPPMPAIARILALYQRDQLAGFIEVAIGLLDLADGDPDIEPNGDELDGTGGEDDFMDHAHAGPGCPVSDPDACAAGDDNLDDWALGRFDPIREDDEDDDPAGDPLDKGEMGDGPLYATLPVYGIDQSQGPLNEHAAHRAYMEALRQGGPRRGCPHPMN